MPTPSPTARGRRSSTLVPLGSEEQWSDEHDASASLLGSSALLSPVSATSPSPSSRRRQHRRSSSSTSSTLPLRDSMADSLRRSQRGHARARSRLRPVKLEEELFEDDSKEKALMRWLSSESNADDDVHEDDSTMVVADRTFSNVGSTVAVVGSGAQKGLVTNEDVHGTIVVKGDTADQYLRLQRGQSFPSVAELKQLPEEMRRTVRAVALRVLHFRLAPMIAVIMRRRAKSVLLRQLLTRARGANCAPPVSLLASLSCFAGWEHLDEVSRAFVPHSFVEGEIVVHQKEGRASGLFYLAHGAARDQESEADQLGISAPAIARRVAAHFAALHGPMHKLAGRLAPGGTKSGSGDGGSSSNPAGGGGGGGGARITLPPALHAHAPGSILGDVCLATGHPQRRSIKVTSKYAVVYVLSCASFNDFFESQAPDVQSRCRAEALEQRLAGMREAHPVEHATLRPFDEFSSLDEATLDLVVEKLQPRVLLPQGLLYKAGEIASSLFLLVRGSLLMTSSGSARSGSCTTSAGCDTSGKSIIVNAPAVVGDFSWGQTTRRRQTCTAAPTTHCDLYVLHKESLRAALSTKEFGVSVERAETHEPGVDPAGRQASGKNESTAFLRYFPYVRGIPLLASHLPELDDPSDTRFPLLRELAEAFKRTVFQPKSTIASATQECDRIIVILSGHAVAQVPDRRSGSTMNVPLVAHEPVGFTLLVAHRWACRVAATDAVEAITIGVDEYESIIKRHSKVLYHAIAKLTAALLFPEAVEPRLASEARAAVAHLRNPPLYPQSSSFTVTEICRYPTEAKLTKLSPIRMKCCNAGSSSASSSGGLSKHSMARIITCDHKMPPANLLNPDGTMRPMILGAVTRVTMGYRQAPRLEASAATTTATSDVPDERNRGVRRRKVGPTEGSRL